MVEINIIQQKTVLEIPQLTNTVTIQSLSELPAGYKAIIDKFFSTFEIVSIKEKQHNEQKVDFLEIQ